MSPVLQSPSAATLAPFVRRSILNLASAICSCAVLLGAMRSLAAAESPSHDPQRVAALIRQLGADKFQDREAASRALEAAGAEALEPLRQAAKSTDLEIARRAAEIIPIVERNVEIAALIQVVANDPERSKRRDAVQRLGEHGKHAAHAFPVLLAAMNDEHSGLDSQATLALARIDPARAIPQLIDRVKRPADRRELPAIQALGVIGSPASEAVPILVQTLGSKDKLARIDAARALGAIGGDHPRQVPALLKMLNEADLEVKQQAAETVGRLKRAPADCVPRLAALLRPNQPRPSDWTDALMLSDLQRRALKERLWNQYLRTVLGAVSEFGSDAKEAVPALIELLQRPDEDTQVFGEAIQALERIGPAAEAAIPILQDLAEGRLYSGAFAREANPALNAIRKTAP
ncbi:MAG: HEAT repeat domain-containing protein [Planctomycetia bacterium]|nr:HEAT repeat domain-containing protein [Planctomycetia bacterium]